MSKAPDPKFWTPVEHHGKVLYTCNLCRTAPREAFNCKAHEKTQIHQSKVKKTNPPPAPTVSSAFVIQDGLCALVRSGSSCPRQSLYPTGSTYYREPQSDPHLFDSLEEGCSPATGIHWNVDKPSANTQAELSHEQQIRAELCDLSMSILNSDSNVEFGAGLRPDSDSEEKESSASSNHSIRIDESQPHKRARRMDTDAAEAAKWYPWPDRITCTLDIITHIPRSVFSRKQLDLFLWLLRANQVDDVPSTSTTKTANENLQKICGIQTLQYDGKMGHRYYVNSLRQILAQEMCNPKVRPHLSFYPEDANKHLDEARQVSRWLAELPFDKATPMIRLKSGDYYTLEPAMLKDGSFCIPYCWFTRDHRTVRQDSSRVAETNEFYAHAWTLDPIQDGWVVREDEERVICEDQLLQNFPQLSKDHRRYSVPHPSLITGVQLKGPLHAGLVPWTYTKPVDGNRWRDLAKGSCCLSVPLWTYCDDTSGNQSKKWNKHNSFLFTLASLPRKHSAKEYNIHFLCTSNIAPPLEMLDGIVSQIELGQKTGFWAWDSQYKEPVLLIPSILALLGDNPMHSELACHIGLRGKFFCRTCWVKGTDAQDTGNILLPTSDLSPNVSPTHSAASSDNLPSDIEPLSPTSSTTPFAPQTNTTRTATPPLPSSVPMPKPPRTGYIESMDAMLKRIRSFVKTNAPRYKAQTQEKLKSFFHLAKSVGTKTKLKLEKTETGIKDVMQDFFIDKLFAASQDPHPTQTKQQALDAAVNQLPADITSPVWRLSLDPHTDTPVEILHVVLLGFVKYFWRDAVQNQANDIQKKSLVSRLNSLDVAGLGISPLQGETLVKYAGSLTGRDFRAITQVAPFVIYDIVPPEVYDAWVALSTLVPLIWQPHIDNIDQYCADLESRIKDFLLKTAKWNGAWFNKSKFHIILHLPDHIRRFGPAILFATEAFESFNAVIRAKSIHSNRLAPSHDIAFGFAQGNRIHHLFSGGFFLPSELLDSWYKDPKSIHATQWKTVASAPQDLFNEDPIPGNYLGLSNPVPSRAGKSKRNDQRPQPWRNTLTGTHLPGAFARHPAAQCATCSKVVLQNEDSCAVGQYVVVQSQGETPSIARVREILQIVGSDNPTAPDAILLQPMHCMFPDASSEPLPMPRLAPQNTWALVELPDIKCTVNTQHNCRLYQCDATGTKAIRQERANTSEVTKIVQHLKRPDDRILNTAQMRDANWLASFRISWPPIDEEQAILESVRQFIDRRKSQGAGGGGRGKGKGRALPRGRGRGCIQPVVISSTGFSLGQ